MKILAVIDMQNDFITGLRAMRQCQINIEDWGPGGPRP